MVELWREAFEQYKDITGSDILDQAPDLYRLLEGCSDYIAIVDVLVKTADDFGLYRHPSSGDVRAKLRGALQPIVRVVLSSGVLDAGGEVAASMVRM